MMYLHLYNMQLSFRSFSYRLNHVMDYLRGGTDCHGIIHVGNTAGKMGPEVCLKNVRRIQDVVRRAWRIS